MKITPRLIEYLKTENGGWTKEDLRVLGVKWPPKSGWQEAILGKGVEMPLNWQIPNYRDFEMDGEMERSCRNCEHVFELPRAGRWILYCGWWDSRVVRPKKLCDEFLLMTKL